MTATMTVCVVGLGYIGLPTAAMLAAGGVQVHGVDVNQATADAVAAGRVPFVEADLAELVDRVVAEGRLTAGTVVTAADAHIIAVPTPVRADRSADGCAKAPADSQPYHDSEEWECDCGYPRPDAGRESRTEKAIWRYRSHRTSGIGIKPRTAAVFSPVYGTVHAENG